MLTKLEVYNPRIVAPLALPISGLSTTNSYQVRKIDGLGPVNASVNTRKFGSIDGEWYADSSIGKRNIVLTIGYQPTWATQSIESLRQSLYSYFMPKSEVRLRFTSTHLETVEIVGYVESFEPNIFSQDPEVQVSIICPKPSFVSIVEKIVTGATLTLTSASVTSITYLGSVETGFILDVKKGSGGDLSGQVQIVNDAPTQELFSINPVVVNASQFLEVSTVPGSKYVKKKFVSGATPVNILGGVPVNSPWLQLKSGLNNFRVQATISGNAWTLRYYNKYGGL